MTPRVETLHAPHGIDAEQIVKKILADHLAEREALWAKLPRFDLKAVFAGHPYVCRFDLPKNKVSYADIRRISAPHPGYMIWAGEWLFYGDDEQSLIEMENFFRMADTKVLGLLEVQR